jgi:predicted PurR-regulated permease PerM
MSLLGAPYAVLMALLFGALYLIPYVGPAISAASLFLVTGLGTRTGSWLIPTQSNWSFALVLLVVFLVVHFTYDNLVYPRMVGKSVGLNPVVSMFVIFSGGALFGLIGMILAFPIAGSVKVIMDRLMRMMSAPDPTELGLPAVPFRHRSAVAKT